MVLTLNHLVHAGYWPQCECCKKIYGPYEKPLCFNCVESNPVGVGTPTKYYATYRCNHIIRANRMIDFIRSLKSFEYGNG